MSPTSPVWWERRRGENRTCLPDKSAQMKKIIIYGNLFGLNMATKCDCGKELENIGVIIEDDFGFIEIDSMYCVECMVVVD